MIPTNVPTVVEKRAVLSADLVCKCMKRVAPQVGFEPTTLRLTAERIHTARLSARRVQPAAGELLLVLTSPMPSSATRLEPEIHPTPSRVPRRETHEDGVNKPVRRRKSNDVRY
jgi:hypothetical protein